MIFIIATIAGNGQAAEHEVMMLNKGEKGMMVFEPDLILANPGDTIRFIPSDKGHNVQSIDAMLPDGVKEFKSEYNTEFRLKVEEEGFYGVKCTLHYGMGMVALIAVGKPANGASARTAKNPSKPRKRFADIFSAYDAAK